MKIIVAGGGIGGMALGLSLLDAGLADVEVFESARSIKELGVGDRCFCCTRRAS